MKEVRISTDWRNITNGHIILSEGYCDQPYVVITNDGNWLCVLTVSKEVEGVNDQHIISTISTNEGRNWSVSVDIEPPGPPESSWAMPLKVPSGRIYVFYNHNTDNIRQIIAGTEYARKRVDTLGYFVFKYSDDYGRTWSKERYKISMRVMKIDHENPYQGKVLFFWGVGKPIVYNDSVYIGLSKVGGFGEGFIVKSECIFFKSDNILTENDPTKIRWETLPDGDEGLKAPEGPIAEEHNLVALKDSSLYCTYRTTQGYNCQAYSRDGGHTWTPPQYATYVPNGRRIKHPRAANFVRKFSNGKYLLWYHNHRGKSYQGRNPAWLCGGIEKDGLIYWSQPEIVLYADDPNVRMSYPDFIEDNGRFFITETQKKVARVHEIDATLLDDLWNQSELREVTEDGLVLNLGAEQCKVGATVDVPCLPDLSQSGGFALDFWINFSELSSGQIILDTCDESGKGVSLTTTEMRTIKITLNDGRTEFSWDCDRGILKTDIWHHLAIIVDGGPKVITFVVDGILCDGGTFRQFGWGRFNQNLGDVNGADKLNIASLFNGQLKLLRIYNRYLWTTEAVGNYHAGF